MGTEEAKRYIRDLLCEYFDEFGSEKNLRTSAIFERINDDAHVKEKGGISRGLVEASLDSLADEALIRPHYGGYQALPGTYRAWHDAKQTENDHAVEDEWAPIQVENYEDVASNIDEVAETLGAENGYMAECPLEAEHTIEESKNLSASLRKNGGSALRKRLRYFITLLEKVLTIFDKGHRVGDAVAKLSALISNFLS